MNQKVIIILLAGFIIRLLSSCEGWCDHVKYYNFTKIELINVNQNIAGNDSLKFNVRQLDNELLACKRLNLINSEYAFDCDVKIYRENGDTLIANSEEIIWE